MNYNTCLNCQQTLQLFHHNYFTTHRLKQHVASETGLYPQHDILIITEGRQKNWRDMCGYFGSSPVLQTALTLHSVHALEGCLIETYLSIYHKI